MRAQEPFTMFSERLVMSVAARCLFVVVRPGPDAHCFVDFNPFA